MGRAFAFVDRDGTILRDPGYVHRIEDYALLPGVVEGLRALAAAGYALAIVTNQSGIGRGIFGEADFERLQTHLLADLARQGVQVEATFHCPHHPDAGCACRKPRTGMLERAARELGADLSRSFVIGDQETDVELAHRAGCRAVRLRPGPTESAPDLICAPDLREAARAIAALTS